MDFKELTVNDMMVIKESLEYSKMHVENNDNTNYPNYKVKGDKLDQIESVLSKVRDVING